MDPICISTQICTPKFNEPSHRHLAEAKHKSVVLRKWHIYRCTYIYIPTYLNLCLCYLKKQVDVDIRLLQSNIVRSVRLFVWFVYFLSYKSTQLQHTQTSEDAIYISDNLLVLCYFSIIVFIFILQNILYKHTKMAMPISLQRSYWCPLVISENKQMQLAY